MTPIYHIGQESNIIPQTLPPGLSTDTVKISQQPERPDIVLCVSGNVIGTFTAKLTLGKSAPTKVPLELPISPKSRLRANWSSKVAEAKALREQTPNPVQDLINFFASLPGDYATWREIVEEPYG